MISTKEVRHIAKLARISLSEKDEEKFRKELSSILDYFNLLKKIKIDKVLPTSHAAKIENVMRQDKAKKEEKERISKLIEASPEKKDKYFKVKPIL